MRRRRRRAAVAARLAAGAVLAASAVLAVGAPAADAQTACGATPGEQCTQLQVPLDRSGSVPGTITLSVTRTPATSGHSSGALVALAGGPGQAAVPLVKHFSQLFAPALTTRDLVVFDPRGTGGSGLLSCPGLDQVNSAASLALQSQACANSLGAARPFYTTRDAVDDLEAVRQSIGVNKIALFGGSYGTRVALSYASRYPQHVEMLILDSVLPLDASAFSQDSFAAVPRVLGDMCASACAGITSNPVGDVASLAARLAAKPARGKVRLPNGHAVGATIGPTTLFNLLGATDLDPLLRAEFPGVVRSTLNGDLAPLLRMLRQGGASVAAPTSSNFSVAVNFATNCEDYGFPWSRTGAISDRAAQALAAARGLPASAFSPFSPVVALGIPPISQCLFWPQAPNPPLINGGPLPSVPTLLLEGVDDLRTPIEGARRVAQQIPGASLVQVPDTGHDTLDNDPHGCASTALAHFIAGQPIGPCSSPGKLVSPFPVAPRSLSAVPGSGRGAKTVAAAGETITDVERAAVEDAISAGSPTSTIHDVGLRGGSFSGQFDAQLHLRRVVYVPGVAVSGTIDETKGVAHLRISGRAAVHRSVTLTKRTTTPKPPKPSLSSTPGATRYLQSLIQRRRFSVAGGAYRSGLPSPFRIR